MSSEQFQVVHDQISVTGRHLLEYLQEIRAGRLTEGDDTKGWQSVEDDITKALKALKDQKYQVAVIAAMKAGKSTFLNAVIGADILASETAACTVCRTDIRHIEAGQVPRLLEYQEGKRQPVVIAEGDAGEIQQKFLARTREIRDRANPDHTVSFEIEYPIEAISTLSSLSGFTLVDTPGPNEWESANFNTVALKQTALEALRTCNAILFVLNYASYKDNAVSDLFKDVVQNRQELLADNKGKIYFILNKVDQKTERDREIPDVIEDLKRELAGFSFPNPIIYPASSRKGLLAKLLKQGEATESQIRDFKKFFSAGYATEDEEGNQIIPAPRKIAAQALEDSGIPTIQETVIQTITQNSGWNLLSDVLAKIDKAAKAIENLLNTQIASWDMEIETLKQKVEEYSRRAESTKSKVEAVKKSVELQKHTLITGFSQGISRFAEGAKAKIEDEINQIAESKSAKTINSSAQKRLKQHQNIDIPTQEMNRGFSILNWFPVFGGPSSSFETKPPLLEEFKRAILTYFDNQNAAGSKTFDPYKIRVKNREEAQNIERTINKFCASHIQSWWIDTQDKLVRDGSKIREELVEKIQDNIQEISDEMSSYIGGSLQADLNINPIHFPSFEFPGIDARIKHQQEVFINSRKEERRENRCCDSDNVYHIDVPFQDRRSVYEVDLRQTVEAIKLKIDEQVSRNQQLLERVIEKQVSADFRSAQKQINDYIDSFQSLFNQVLTERETKQEKAPHIRATLEAKKVRLNKDLCELVKIRKSLDSWKPVVH